MTIEPVLQVRLRRELAGVAARIGFRADVHVRDVVEAAERAMERRGRTDLEAYVADLVTGRELADPWIEEVVVQETYFFRDLVQLEWLARAVLAPLAYGATHDAPLRVWSAGCASGEETHTLAVLLYELGAARRASVLGTDISPGAIRRARLATYGSFALRGAHGDRMRPYLELAGERYRVRSEIRALSEFRRGNLATTADASDPAPGTVSLILCRNLLIYFSEEAAAHAAERFARAAAPGATLLTAASDPPIAGLSGWARVPGAVGAYQRREGASALVPADGAFPADAWKSAASILHSVHLPAAPPVVEAPPEAPAEAAPLPPDAPSPPAPPEPNLEAAHHHERALSLLEAGDVDGALAAARKVTYLAPELAMGHFTLALVALRGGSIAIARRSYREAGRLALAASPDAELALGDGLRAAEIARSSARQLERLDLQGVAR